MIVYNKFNQNIILQELILNEKISQFISIDISELRVTIKIIERSLVKTNENLQKEISRKNHRTTTLLIYWSKISQERQLERLRNTLAIELKVDYNFMNNTLDLEITKE